MTKGLLSDIHRSMLGDRVADHVERRARRIEVLDDVWFVAKLVLAVSVSIASAVLTALLLYGAWTVKVWLEELSR